MRKQKQDESREHYLLRVILRYLDEMANSDQAGVLDKMIEFDGGEWKADNLRGEIVECINK